MMSLRLPARSSILLSLRKLFCFPRVSFHPACRCSLVCDQRDLFAQEFGEGVCKKGPRDFHRRSKSGRKRPGAGSDSGDHRSLHIVADGKVECIDESQFGTRLKLFATPADIRQGVDDLPDAGAAENRRSPRIPVPDYKNI